MSNMTTQRRADLRAMADAEYASIKGGEVYHTVHHPDFMGLLDDADRCAELEAVIRGVLGFIENEPRENCARDKLLAVITKQPTPRTNPHPSE